MKRTRLALFLLAAVLILPAFAKAAPTQDEVFRSINQNVGGTVDIKKFYPYLAGIVGLVIMACLYNNRQNRPLTGPKLNHSGKLVREVSRRIHLRKIEVKQLRLLADEQNLENPLTLLLCPSVLGKAARTKNPRVDRRVLQQIVQRMRQGLAEADVRRAQQSGAISSTSAKTAPTKSIAARTAAARRVPTRPIAAPQIPIRR